MVRSVVRDIARRSRCKEASLLDCLSGESSASVSANTAFSATRAQILRLLRIKALALIVRDLRSFSLLLPILLLTPGLAQAQTAPPPSADIQRERVEQLKELVRTKKEMQHQLDEFDARIAALEASLGVTPSQDEQPQGDSDATAATAAVSTAALASPGNTLVSDPGVYEPGSLNKPGPKEVMGFPYEAR